MNKVFDMFTQIESELGRSEGGLGIGLALARGLVQLRPADVWKCIAPGPVWAVNS